MQIDIQRWIQGWRTLRITFVNSKEIKDNGTSVNCTNYMFILSGTSFKFRNAQNALGKELDGTISIEGRAWRWILIQCSLHVSQSHQNTCVVLLIWSVLDMMVECCTITKLRDYAFFLLELILFILANSSEHNIFRWVCLTSLSKYDAGILFTSNEYNLDNQIGLQSTSKQAHVWLVKLYETKTFWWWKVLFDYSR